MNRQRVHVHVIPHPSGLVRVELRCPRCGSVSRLGAGHPHGIVALLVPALRATGCRHAIDLPAGRLPASPTTASAGLPGAHPPQPGREVVLTTGFGATERSCDR